MGVGESQGSNSAYEAIKSAIESPLLDNMSINGAMGVLVHFNIHPDYPLVDISEAMDIVYESADEDAHVIFGTTTDENMEPDRVKITIVTTGFEQEEEKESAKEGLTLVTPKQESPQTKRIKVSGGYETNEEILDIPTFLRNQMD